MQPAQRQRLQREPGGGLLVAGRPHPGERCVHRTHVALLVDGAGGGGGGGRVFARVEGKAHASSKKTQEESFTSLFTDLRKVANHPLLLDNQTGAVATKYTRDPAVLPRLAFLLHRLGAFGHSCTVPMVLAQLTETSDFGLHALCCEYGFDACAEVYRMRLTPAEINESSGKFVHLRTLLPQLKKDGHRVLLFSQWTSMLDILEVFLGEEGLDMDYLRLDGSTDSKARQRMIDE